MEVPQMMGQYLEIKEKHKDHILFYRLGDFYEMFFDDAITASRELELTLTKKRFGNGNTAPMCGVPAKSYEIYVGRLIKKGYKVAIAEQMEPAGKGVKLVAREVIRVVTPGTVIENSLLEEGQNNYICGLYISGARAGMAFCDVSTGEFSLTETTGEDVSTAVINELSRFLPKEIITNTAIASYKEVVSFIQRNLPVATEQLAEEEFALDVNTKRMLEHFKKENPEELGLEKKPYAMAAAGVVLDYIYKTQRVGVERISSLDLYGDKQYMDLDVNARKNLELTETLRDGELRGSLLWVLDKTRTAMGKRLIKSYLTQPLLNPVSINRRLDAVQELYRDTMLRGDLGEQLADVHDLQRLMTRIVYGNTTPREMKSLAYTCEKLPLIKSRLGDAETQLLRTIWKEIDELGDIQSLIDLAIDENPPITLKDGGVIRPGFNKDVDDLRDIVTNTKQYLSKIEAEEKEKTNIRTLKIGYNKVFGYYIEVSNSFVDQVPETYIRKQTLTGGERYITQELKELEAKILGASERILQLETALFEDIRKKVAENLDRIQLTARALARLDVLYAFAEASVQNGYQRPEVDLSGVIHIVDGRHPVVEQVLKDEPFVSNNVELDKDKNRIMMITGPNMAGKSTYMRQVALIVLMAQIGCFVPAASAKIGVVDRIFTRIGASDDLSSGQSTFMVEMNEVAHILKNATADSLIILDEIGRGTSTYDGMSIARSVLEYIADRKKVGAKTLFATHYHELTELEEKVEGVRNFNVAVKKRGDEITFIRRIVKGAADDSYGIEVSKLAGIPDRVVSRAKEILRDLEEGKEIPVKKSIQKTEEEESLTLFDMQNQEVIRRLKETDVEMLTPLEAINLLYKIKSDLK